MTTSGARALPRDHLTSALKYARRTLRHAWIVPIVLVVGASLTLAVIRFKPKHYLSQTVLYYQEGFQWDLPNESTRNLGQRLKETVLARVRLQDLIEELGLYPRLVRAGKMDDAIEQMRRSTVFRVNEGDTFTISFVADSPALAQRVTARLADMLIADNARLKSEQIELAKSFLDAQRTRNEEILRTKEVELARFVANHPEIAQDTTTAAGPLQGGGARDELPSRAAQAIPAPAAGPQESAGSSGYAALVAAEREAQANLEAAQRTFAEQTRGLTERHPAYAAAAAPLKKAEQAHQRALEALGAAAPAPHGQAEPAPRVVVRDLPVRSRPRFRNQAQAALALEEYARLTRELAEARERFQKLDTRQFVATMAATSFTGGHAAQITIIDPAYTPTRPTGAKNSMLLAAGVAGSLLVGFALAILRVVFDDRVYDGEDVERLGLAPVLSEVRGLQTRERRDAGRTAAMQRAVEAAPEQQTTAIARPHGPSAAAAAGSLALAAVASEGSVPSLAPLDASPGAADARVVLVDGRDSATAAGFRVLRHRLMESRRPKSILVTSPEAGEGKTTCAINLALALGEGGRARVLLVDANFATPALAHALRLQTASGDGGEGEEGPWARLDVITPCLHVASARADADVSFVDGKTLSGCLERFGAAGYDFIVIDGPPVLGGAEANAIEECVSGVVITAWSRRSRASRLRAAVDQLGSRKLLGFVVMRS